MAQQVGYFEDNVEYTEGPFVLVYACGWRIEVELKGHHCPVLMQLSIYELLANKKLYFGKSNNREQVAAAVDWLNAQVKRGVITLNQNGIWDVAP